MADQQAPIPCCKRPVRRYMVRAISYSAIARASLTVTQGDPQGIALVAEVCEPQRQGKSGHFIVASLGSDNIDPDTLEYLKRRGCFDLPHLNIQQELVKAYFHYVHPFFPVVQVSSFLQAFGSREQKGTSLHLLWSVFLAAANVA